MTQEVLLDSEKVLREPGHLMGQALKAKDLCMARSPCNPQYIQLYLQSLSATSCAYYFSIEKILLARGPRITIVEAPIPVQDPIGNTVISIELGLNF